MHGVGPGRESRDQVQGDVAIQIKLLPVAGGTQQLGCAGAPLGSIKSHVALRLRTWYVEGSPVGRQCNGLAES